MPRTKQPRKRSQTEQNSTSQAATLIVEDFQRKCSTERFRLERKYNMVISNMIKRFEADRDRLPKPWLELPLEKLYSFFDTIDENRDAGNKVSKLNVEKKHSTNVIPASTIKTKKGVKRQTTASTDDGYITESSIQPAARKHTSRIDSKGIRSTVKRRVARSNSSNTNRRTVLNTPASKQLNSVTPKVKPNTPLNILRHPRDGEVAMSMQGSPLFISSTKSRTAEVNVPLNDGYVMSLLPRDGLSLSNVPHLDEETVIQLQTLKMHIEKVLDYGN